MNHLVTTAEFHGPLDLLLELIQRRELEITELSLSKITTEYLRAIDNLPERSPDELSAFLYVAARLVLLKSRVLLQTPAEETEEETGEISLEEQLRQYQAYKDASERLSELRSRGESYAAGARRLPAPEAFIPISREQFESLASVYEEVLRQHLPLPEPETLPQATVSLEERTAHLQELLRIDHRIHLEQVFRTCQSRTEVIVTFLAMLELLKQRLGRVTQAAAFAPIVMEAA